MERDCVQNQSCMHCHCQTDSLVATKSHDAEKDDGVNEQMLYIQKCYDDVVQMKRMFLVY